LSIDKWPENPILARDEKILAAVKSLFIKDPSACLLLINGDIAYAGLEGEYDLAMGFLTNIRTGLAGLYGSHACFTALLPGNHDCNFSVDNDARRQLIKDPNLNAFGDGSIIQICTNVQDHFFDFCTNFRQAASPISGIARIFENHVFKVGDEEIVVRVLNSAWCSQIHEKSGSLLMPLEVLRPLLAVPASAAVVATALHHPYGWLEPSSARPLRELIESSTDLVFTGHEHVAESYTKTGSIGEQNEYIEGGALQENNSPGHSEFNVVVVDTIQQTYVVHHFSWSDEIYDVVNDPIERPFIRNNSRLQSEFELNDHFREELNDADSPYKHPFKETVLLSDIFLYPHFKEFAPFAGKGQSAKESQPPPPRNRDTFGGQSKAESKVQLIRHTVKGREILDYALSKKRVVITAGDKAGKTVDLPTFSGRSA
jgi:hypothetical protein